MSDTLYKNKQVIAFDLDGTLTPSKRPITNEVANLFCQLLQSKKVVAVMSGGTFSRFLTQFIQCLPTSTNPELFTNLYLFPLDGSAFYRYVKGEWVQIYEEPFSKHEKREIIEAIKKAEHDVLGLVRDKVYGEVIEDRGSQITFSALGQEAPLPEKLRWDPNHSKRKSITDFLRIRLPSYDVKIGGTTSVDVNKKGVNKAYALRKLEQYSGVPISEMLFVGDAIFKGGNDYQALETGVDYVKVDGPEDTAKLIKNILSM